MPLTLSIEEHYFEEENNKIKSMRINMPGIVHFIVDTDKVVNRDKLFRIAKNEMDNVKYDAFGIIFYSYKDNFLTPLVYVKWY